MLYNKPLTNKKTIINGCFTNNPFARYPIDSSIKCIFEKMFNTNEWSFNQNIFESFEPIQKEKPRKIEPFGICWRAFLFFINYFPVKEGFSV